MSLMPPRRWLRIAGSSKATSFRPTRTPTPRDLDFRNTPAHQAPSRRDGTVNASGNCQMSETGPCERYGQAGPA